MGKNKRKSEITRYLTENEKSHFLSELIDAIEISKISGNFDAINECLLSWEDVVELNSIPKFKEKVWDRFNKLKSAGRIQ